MLLSWYSARDAVYPSDQFRNPRVDRRFTLTCRRSPRRDADEVPSSFSPAHQRSTGIALKKLRDAFMSKTKLIAADRKANNCRDPPC